MSGSRKSTGIKLSDYNFTDLKNYPNVGRDKDGNLVEFSFNGNSFLRPANTKLFLTKEALEEWKKCAEDKIYFFENYLKIQTLDHGIIQFKPRDYQYEFFDLVDKHNRIIMMQARQCITKDTKINILEENETKKEITIEDLFEEAKNDFLKDNQ